MGCEQLKSLNTARCECGFLNKLPAVCSRIIYFINLSLKVSTPNRDLRLLSSSNFTEIRSGIKKERNWASVEVQLCFGKFGSQVLGKIKHFLWRAWQGGYLHSASLGTEVTAGQKINDTLTSCLAQAEPVSPRRWRGSGARGYPGPFTASAGMWIFWAPKGNCYLAWSLNLPIQLSLKPRLCFCTAANGEICFAVIPFCLSALQKCFSRLPLPFASLPAPGRMGDH